MLTNLLRPQLRKLRCQASTLHFGANIPHNARFASNKRVINQNPHIPSHAPVKPNLVYKRANMAMLGGKVIRFGNNVPESNQKTRRIWRPNVVKKHMFSQVLEKKIDVRMATSVLRTINKCGGLDQYVLGSTPSRLKELGVKGWNIRM